MKNAIACGFELLPHPPYPPDPASSDYHFSPHMKKYFRGHKFKDDDVAKHVVRKGLEEFTADFFKEDLEARRSDTRNVSPWMEIMWRNKVKYAVKDILI